MCYVVVMPTPEPSTLVEPLFRRPTRGDALALARKEFLAGERVDMQILAARLNVGRTTLYRWVGDREQLLGEMLSELANELLARTAAQATGTGLDRFLASIRSYLERCIGSAAFRTFLDREPEIALRLIMSRRSPLFRRTAEGVAELLDQAVPTTGREDRDHLAELVVQVGSALVSAAHAVGDEPDVDRAMEVTRTLIEARIKTH
jgi:AcrR family transcriptional regulator